MKPHIKKFGLALAMTAAFHTAASAELSIMSLAQGVTELDLFSPAPSGVYVKTVGPSALQFPIAILEDRNGGFIVRLEGKKYYIGAADVVTNKVYQVTAGCDNAFTTSPAAATRGIAGKGC